MSADAAVLPVGGVFHGRYQVVRCIKAGGMGAVYEVVHLETRRRRALKVMLPSIVTDEAMRERFRLEATIAAEIDSEDVVETFDAGVDAQTGAPFLVMELLRGEELGAVLERRTRLPPLEAVLLLWQAATALDKTHAAGIVHRDLKPENLFVSYRDDGAPRLKILDFGIAKVIARSVSAALRTTTTIGTPLYMSPEQISGDGAIGPRSDVYALGHIAYTVLVGEPFWAEEEAAAPSTVSLVMKIMHGTTASPTARAARWGVALPAGFDPWFARATALAAEDRFDKASSLVAALASVLGVGLPRVSVTIGKPSDGVRALARSLGPPRIDPSATAGPRVGPSAASDDSAPTAPGREAGAPAPGGALCVAATELDVPVVWAPHGAAAAPRTTGAVVSEPPLRRTARSVLPLLLAALGLVAAVGTGALVFRGGTGPGPRGVSASSTAEAPVAAEGVPAPSSALVGAEPRIAPNSSASEPSAPAASASSGHVQSGSAPRLERRPRATSSPAPAAPAPTLQID